MNGVHNTIGKVTCFITRGSGDARELLLLHHPSAGIQLPAGTVELGESFEAAAVREAIEETGIAHFSACMRIGSNEQVLQQQYVTYDDAKIYARPDVTSFQWAQIRRGITVKHERSENGFVQVTYEEGDKYPHPNYITYQITGWTEAHCLASRVERQFYHLETSEARDEWKVETDHQTFMLRWYAWHRLPTIVAPQREWLSYALEALN